MVADESHKSDSGEAHLYLLQLCDVLAAAGLLLCHDALEHMLHLLHAFLVVTACVNSQGL